MRHRYHAGALDFGRWLSRVVLAILALVGAAAVALPFLFGLRPVRAAIERAVASAVKSETGIDLSLRIERALWPPGIVVRDIEVASTAPGRPFARVREARVTLRPFALLSGRVVVDMVELDSPNVDVELVDGKPVNLPLHLKPHPATKTEGTEPPFRVIAVTGAQVRLSSQSGSAPPMALDLTGVDLDVDVLGEGTPVYDLRIHKGTGTTHTVRTLLAHSPPPDRFIHAAAKTPVEPRTIHDDDAICNLALDVSLTDAATARVVHLRRVDVDVRLDRDEQSGPPPSCAAGDTAPEQVVAARVERVDLELPKDDAPPRLTFGASGARARVRAPALLAARYLKLPALGGWLQVELDITAAIDFRDPLSGILRASMNGRFDAQELRFSYYRFGSAIGGDLSIRPPLVIGARRIVARYGEGDVTLTDVEVGAAPQPIPGKKSLPLKATIAIKDMTMPGLMRELGVSKASHVHWDLSEGTAKLAGYLEPLQLDGDLALKTKGFEVAQRPVEKPAPAHIIGVAKKHGAGNADVSAHVSVRPSHIAFESIHARLGSTQIDARTLIGFESELEVDVHSDQLDLSDISPLTTFQLGGLGKLDFKIRGSTEDLLGEGTVAFDGFIFDQFKLGDVDRGIVRFRGQSIEIEDLHVLHGESRYEVSSMRIDLGPAHGAVVDALAKSSNFALDDFYQIFKLTDDPRWQDIRGHVGFDTRVHFVVGGERDPCGEGRLDLDIRANILAFDLWGERYDGGSADVSLSWFDREAGALGMDLDLHAATLRKKGGGTVIASGEITRGGRLSIKANASGVSLRSLSAMPTTTIPIDGGLDAVATVGGTLDTMRVDADVYVSPVQIGDYALPRSHVRVVREPLPTLAPSPMPNARGCYTGRKFPPFDPTRWASDPVEGEFSMTGELFGGAVKLDDFRLTDQRKKVAHGTVAIRNLDLAPLALLRPESAAVALEDKYTPPPPPFRIAGRLSADLVLQRYPLDAWWDAEGRVEDVALDVERGEIRLATVAPTPVIRFGADGAILGETNLDLRIGDSATKVQVAAEIDKRPKARDPITKSPALRAHLDVPMIPLSRLEDLVPRIERAEGQARAKLRVGGTVAAPTWDGELAVENAGLTVKGLAMPIVGVTGKIEVDPRLGVRIAKLHGEVGGGTIDVSGGADLRGFGLGDVDVKVLARDVHFRYGDGVSTTLGADLRATWTPPEEGAVADLASLVGVVEIDAFLYERPVKLFDVNTVGVAKRTEVEIYDPSRDVMRMDIELRAKHGLRVRNNLVDATLAVGPTGLRVLGTNQRFTPSGDLFVQKGGVLKFRRHDFEITEGTINFADEVKIDPNIDVSAVTDVRRAAGIGATAEWRIRLHAFGPVSELKVELTSEPPLPQEDVVALLVLGLTRAELNQAGGVAGGLGLDLLGETAGVSQTIRQAIPVIDDFQVGTAYSVRTGRTDPQITLGKRLTDNLRASVTAGLVERSERSANIEWQWSRQLSLRASYDNVNDVSSASIGNVGTDIRYRLEFE